MPISARVNCPTYIDADRLYTIQSFIESSAVTHTRIRTAEKAGLPFPGFRIGRRRYIDGRAAIEYLHALSEFYAANTTTNTNQN